MSSIQERVALGAEFLDRRAPGWYQRVNLVSLYLGSDNACIIAQLFGHGDYGKGAASLGLRLEEIEEFGFIDLYARYGFLTAEWKKIIKERLEGLQL